MMLTHHVQLSGLRVGKGGASGELVWMESGQGRPLVLLHGIGSDALSWSGQIEAFSPIRRVLAWNAPGYGASDPLAGATATSDLYAMLLGSSLDALGVGTCDIVAHSLGALTAARFMRLHPQRVGMLILSSPASGYGQTPDEPLLPALQARLDDILELGPQGMARRRAARTLSPHACAALVDSAEQAMGRVSVCGYRDAVRLLASGNLSEDLAALPRERVGLITAEHDRIIPPDKVCDLAACHGLAPPQRIADAGHASYIENPAGFTSAIKTALRRSEFPPPD